MASDDTLFIIHPYMHEPPSASGATHDNRNQRPILDMADGGSEVCIFSFVLPRNYAGGGITMAHTLAFSSATAGSGVIQGEFERIGDGQLDLDDNSFAAASVATFPVPPNSGSTTIIDIAFADGAAIDSLAVGEYGRYRLTRQGESTTDDGSGDLEFVIGEARET